MKFFTLEDYLHNFDAIRPVGYFSRSFHIAFSQFSGRKANTISKNSPTNYVRRSQLIVRG